MIFGFFPICVLDPLPWSSAVADGNSRDAWGRCGGHLTPHGHGWRCVVLLSCCLRSLELFPLHSPLLGESWLVSFPPLNYMLKFGG